MDTLSPPPASLPAPGGRLRWAMLALPFVLASVIYLVALGVLHALLPKLEVMKLPDESS